MQVRAVRIRRSEHRGVPPVEHRELSCELRRERHGVGAVVPERERVVAAARGEEPAVTLSAPLRPPVAGVWASVPSGAGNVCTCFPSMRNRLPYLLLPRSTYFLSVASHPK